jgi:hypothetical protein
VDPQFVDVVSGKAPSLFHAGPMWDHMKGGTGMKRYLLSIEQSDGPPPKSVDLDGIRREIDALEKEMKQAGAWVFNDHLAPPTEAAVVVPDDGDVATKKGPYKKGKEHVGGLSIIKAPDMDTALEWGRKLALATTLPVEVREFQGDS